MSYSFKNKVVLVTGASSGIGRATALAFAGQGALLCIAARSADKLQELRQDIEGQGSEALAVAADVSKEEDCRRLIDEAVKRFGRIDVLVNNAGISMRALFEVLDLDVLRRVMAVNFWGSVYCTKYALPHILVTRGSIVGVSSIAGYKGLPARTGYSASKFALQGFLEALRIELLDKHVHVMVICPGFTASNIRNTALNHAGEPQGDSPLDESSIMQPEEVAGHIVRGVAVRKRGIILTSQGKFTVFLNKWFPAWMDRMVFAHFSREKDSPLKKH